MFAQGGLPKAEIPIFGVEQGILKVRSTEAAGRIQRLRIGANAVISYSAGLSACSNKMSQKARSTGASSRDPMVPIEADVLICYSTTISVCSNRDPEKTKTWNFWQRDPMALDWS